MKSAPQVLPSTHPVPEFFSLEQSNITLFQSSPVESANKNKNAMSAFP